MKILISGASGFIGQHLVPALLSLGYQVTVLGRVVDKLNRQFSSDIHVVTWQTLSNENPNEYDAIINLAGASIAGSRWTEKYKAMLYHSRIETTQQLISWCQQAVRKPHLYNASAIGYYGVLKSTPDSNEGSTEEQPRIPLNDHSYSRQLVMDWEKSAWHGEKLGMPVTIMRFGVVLGRDGGMLKLLALPTQFGVGSIAGSGNQPMTWIDIDDLVRAILFLLTKPEITGAINLTAPEFVSQRTFMKMLATTLHRPLWLTLPGWFVKLLFGQMGEELILSGQAVSSARLLSLGFQFHFPTLESSLRHQYPASDA